MNIEEAFDSLKIEAEYAIIEIDREWFDYNIFTCKNLEI